MQRLVKKRACGSLHQIPASDNGALRERAVGFVEMANMSAEAISAKILEVLEPLQLDPALCFGFDAASVMSGIRGGVHVILRRTFPHAVYVCIATHTDIISSCAQQRKCPLVFKLF